MVDVMSHLHSMFHPSLKKQRTIFHNILFSEDQLIAAPSKGENKVGVNSVSPHHQLEFEGWHAKLSYLDERLTCLCDHLYNRAIMSYMHMYLWVHV